MVSDPESAVTIAPSASRSISSAASSASSQETSDSPRGPRRSGSTMRSRARRCGYEKRPLSQSQPRSTSGWLRERMRFTFPSRIVADVLQPTGHAPQTVGTFWISHGRASKRYSVDVSAPTGHSSITLPEKIERYGSSWKVAISLRAPRFRAISWPSSATSSEKRVQR